MDLGTGWNQPESVIRQLVELDWIYDAGTLGTRNNVFPLFEPLGTPDRDTGRGDLRSFQREGWIDLSETYDEESIDCAPLAAGAAFVESVRIKRADIAGRRKAARDAVLHWLYERVAAGEQMPKITDFWLTTNALYYGQHFAVNEIDQATLWLRDKGYVKGLAAMGAGLIRFGITSLAAAEQQDLPIPRPRLPRPLGGGESATTSTTCESQSSDRYTAYRPSRLRLRRSRRVRNLGVTTVHM
jgi:hypothetical protein